MKLQGWTEYFKLAYCQTWAKGLDEWIRRRIRMLLWKTWKCTPTKCRALRKLGCTHGQALMWVNTRKDYWRIAKSHILSSTLTNDFLKSKGWSWVGICLPKDSAWK